MKPRTYKFNTLLEIEWIDIVTESGWLTPTMACKREPCSCKSVGYFLNRDEDVIRISQTFQVTDLERDVTVIPWGVIKKIAQQSRP